MQILTYSMSCITLFKGNMYKPHHPLPCTPVCNGANQYTQFMTMSVDSCSKVQNRSKDFHTYKYNRPNTLLCINMHFFSVLCHGSNYTIRKRHTEENYPPNIFPICYQTLLIYSGRTIHCAYRRAKFHTTSKNTKHGIVSLIEKVLLQPEPIIP